MKGEQADFTVTGYCFTRWPVLPNPNPSATPMLKDILDVVTIRVHQFHFQ